MGNSRNRIVVIVAAALVVVLAVLLFTALGSGGGGGSAPSVASAPVSDSTQSTASVSAASDAEVSDWASGNYEADLARLREELTTSSNAGANVRDAAQSAGSTSAQQAYSDLDDRGFSGMTLQASFSNQGDYREDATVDAGSGETFPSYGGAYLSPEGVLWNVYINDGEVFAVPVASTGTQITQQVILTETDHMVQYDGTTNEYSDWPVGTLSDGSKVVRVSRIDRATLDSYSVADIEAL